MAKPKQKTEVENDKRGRGYAFSVNRKLKIGRDTSWNQDDTAQECYIASCEGYHIIKAVERAAQDFRAVGEVGKREKDRRQFENTERADAIQEYQQRLYRRANPPVIVGGEKIYFDGELDVGHAVETGGEIVPWRLSSAELRAEYRKDGEETPTGWGDVDAIRTDKKWSDAADEMNYEDLGLEEDANYQGFHTDDI